MATQLDTRFELDNTLSALYRNLDILLDNNIITRQTLQPFSPTKTEPAQLNVSSAVTAHPDPKPTMTTPQPFSQAKAKPAQSNVPCTMIVRQAISRPQPSTTIEPYFRPQRPHSSYNSYAGVGLDTAIIEEGLKRD